MAERVLVVALDGFDVGYAERLMRQGELPTLAALRDRSAWFLLDHGDEQRTGLAWEQFASGLTPGDSGRWSMVEFDPSTYRVWQEGARFTPFFEGLDARVVVLDPPYVDLRRAPSVRGLVAWGAHDAGAERASAPVGLLSEITSRFGPYPAGPAMYATPWPSPEGCREMGASLANAVDVRSRVAAWILTEGLPDWDLAIIATGEVHSAMEALWHGVDREHPLHDHPSGPAAAAAMLDVHRAADRMVGAVLGTAGDAHVIVVSMGGMGPNRSDLQSMVLLPELLYRHAFREPLLDVPSAWTERPGSVPIVDDPRPWSALDRAIRPAATPRRGPRSRIAARLPAGAKRVVRRAQRSRSRALRSAPAMLSLEWQPVARYRPWWPQMPAFALPSFYDGRIRVNLEGREHHGTVALRDYQRVCGQLEALLHECRDPRTGERVVERVDRGAVGDPLELDSSGADLVVVWRNTACALEHPHLGLVGPVPMRRTGGHTGVHGVAYLVGGGVEAGFRGVRPSFDVAPTVVDLLGVVPSRPMSGASLLAPVSA